MKVSYDQEVDILYIVIKEGPICDSEELDDDVRVEYDKEDSVIGIEILNGRKNIGKMMAEEIAQQVKALVP